MAEARRRAAERQEKQKQAFDKQTQKMRKIQEDSVSEMSKKAKLAKEKLESLKENENVKKISDKIASKTSQLKFKMPEIPDLKEKLCGMLSKFSEKLRTMELPDMDPPGLPSPSVPDLWAMLGKLKPRRPIPDGESSEESDDEDDGDESSHDDDFEFDHKTTPYINQFNEATKKLFKFPSSNIVIDEMMARFKGRSRDTYRMKAKPIKEGFKYFAIADSQSTFVWHLVPYGRVNTRVGIIDTVKALVDTLPEPDKHNYLVAMDNYFTYDSTVNYVIDQGMNVVESETWVAT